MDFSLILQTDCLGPSLSREREGPMHWDSLRVVLYLPIESESSSLQLRPWRCLTRVPILLGILYHWMGPLLLSPVGSGCVLDCPFPLPCRNRLTGLNLNTSLLVGRPRHRYLFMSVTVWRYSTCPWSLCFVDRRERRTGGYRTFTEGNQFTLVFIPSFTQVTTSGISSRRTPSVVSTLPISYQVRSFQPTPFTF